MPKVRSTSSAPTLMSSTPLRPRPLRHRVMVYATSKLVDGAPVHHALELDANAASRTPRHGDHPGGAFACAAPAPYRCTATARAQRTGAGRPKNMKIPPASPLVVRASPGARSCSSRPRRSARPRGETSTEGCRRRAEGGGTTHRTNAGSARQTPHPPRRVEPRVRERSGCRQSLPGGHQDDGYWRSLRASLIATDDLLTLAVARARGRLNVGVRVRT